MRIDILTLFPDMFKNVFEESIVKRAQELGKLEINIVNFRDYTDDPHKKVDDTPYGGGAGMVLMPQPYVDAYESLEPCENSVTLMMTPQGEVFNNSLCEEFSQYERIVILCGHYEGFDERIRTIINPREVSIGDFVLTGGELPALCLIDSISRKIDGTLGKIESMQEDSFENGLLEYPQYTKPREYRGLKVPDVLLNGNHSLINEYRLNEQLQRTKERRPDLYKSYFKNLEKKFCD